MQTTELPSEVTVTLSNVTSLRKQVFDALNKNPLLTANPICKLLGLSYREHGGYIKKLKYDWKRYHEIERGSIRSVPDGVHNAFFVGLLPLGLVGGAQGKVSDVGFVGSSLRLAGWRVSKSRNRFLLFKSLLGRVRLFETGTVEIYVRKPAHFGKAMQLFCDAFTKTKWITDILEIEAFQKTLRIRGFHATFDTGQRLPYMKIPLFKGTNGFQLILGDRTHPHSAELIIEYMEQVESAKKVIEGIGELLGLNGTGIKRLFDDYSR